MATAPCVQEPLPCIRRQSLVPGLLFLYAAAALCVREHLPHTRRWPLVFGGPSIHAATATCVGEPVPYTRQRPLVSGNSVPITAHRVREPLPPFSLFLFSASGGLFSSLVFLSFSSQCFRMLSFVSAHALSSVHAFACFSFFVNFIASSMQLVFVFEVW